MKAAVSPDTVRVCVPFVYSCSPRRHLPAYSAGEALPGCDASDASDNIGAVSADKNYGFCT